MSTVTVLAIIDFEAKPSAPLTRMMSLRLENFAADLASDLDKELQHSTNFGDLVIYISYNSNYAVRWVIVNDVPASVTAIVEKKCANLGYITWKGVDLYKFIL